MTAAIKPAPLSIDPLRLQIGLSAIATGLSTLQRGKTADGYCLIGHGLDYLKAMAEQQEKRQ